MNKQLFLLFALLGSSEYTIGMEHLQVSSANLTDPAPQPNPHQSWNSAGKDLARAQKAAQSQVTPLDPQLKQTLDELGATPYHPKTLQVALSPEQNQSATPQCGLDTTFLQQIDGLHPEQLQAAASEKELDSKPTDLPNKLDWLDPEDNSPVCAATATPIRVLSTLEASPLIKILKTFSRCE